MFLIKCLLTEFNFVHAFMQEKNDYYFHTIVLFLSHLGNVEILHHYKVKKKQMKKIFHNNMLLI